MTRRRGFTLIEMMIAVSMTALLVGTVTAVYAYTIERMGYSVADYSTQREAEYGLDVIEATIGRAQTCALVSVSGNTCLKCTMPATCTDKNGDGILDSCSPNAINRRSQERWGNGYRVWFYFADSNTVPSGTGPVFFMAKRVDDSTPTASDVVKAYTWYPGNTQLRLDLIQTMTAAAGGTTNQYTATVAVGAYALGHLHAAPANAGTNTSYQFALSRTAYMRGWRL